MSRNGPRQAWWPECVQPPSLPGKLATQLKSPLAILVATAISNIRELFLFIFFGYILVSKKFNLLVYHCYREKPSIYPSISIFQERTLLASFGPSHPKIFSLTVMAGL